VYKRQGEEVVRGGARSVSDLTFDGAQDEELDRVIEDRTSGIVFRKQPAPSRGTLQFARSSIVAGAVSYLSGSVVQTQGGIRFELLQTAAFGVASLGPVSVSARAVDAGIGGNVDANTITRPVTPFPDSTMSVTNPTFFSGGDDAETNAAFRTRGKAFFLAARRGTKAAIEFGALTVEGVRQVSAIENLNNFGYPDGAITAYVADANGQANSDLLELVRVALLEYRAEGIVPTLIGAVPTYVSIVLNLQYETTVDSLAAFEQVRSTIVAEINQLNPNETLDRSLIFTACRSVSGVIVRDDAVTTPAGDVVPTTGQVLRTRDDLITPSAS